MNNADGPDQTATPSLISDGQTTGDIELDAPRTGSNLGYHRLLPYSDVVAILFSMFLAVGLLSLGARDIDLSRLSVTVAVMLPAWFVIAYIVGLYSGADLEINHNLVDDIGKVVVAVTAWSWLLLVAQTALVVGPTAMAGPILLWALAIPTVLSIRVAVRAVARHRAWSRQPVTIIGQGVETQSLRDRIERHPGWGLDVHAEFDFDDDSPIDAADLAGTVQRSGVDRVVIVGGGSFATRTRLIHELVEREVMVDIVSSGPETLYSRASLQSLEGLPVLSIKPSRMRPLDRRMKRAFDLLVSGFGLVLVSPLLVWAAIRIKRDSPGRVFYRQERCGLEGEPFELLKMRTMIDDAHSMRPELREATADSGNDDVLFKLEDDPRTTDFGRKLRKWSIDELPQLWNVFLGEMSMVGPRPLVFDEALQATDIFWTRVQVKPGIAGPWQAHGRSTIPFSEMIKLDYSYAVGWSMAEDIRLLLSTSVAVMRGRGAH